MKAIYNFSMGTQFYALCLQSSIVTSHCMSFIFICIYIISHVFCCFYNCFDVLGKILSILLTLVHVLFGIIPNYKPYIQINVYTNIHIYRIGVAFLSILNFFDADGLDCIYYSVC